jgi:hypothetical protein
LNETLTWLLYVLSGVAAFLAVYHTGWRIVPSMLIGALVTAVGWILLYYATPLDDRPAWFNVQLALNVCFGLIFAGAGAAVAVFLQSRQQEP